MFYIFLGFRTQNRILIVLFCRSVFVTFTHQSCSLCIECRHKLLTTKHENYSKKFYSLSHLRKIDRENFCYVFISTSKTCFTKFLFVFDPSTIKILTNYKNLPDHKIVRCSKLPRQKPKCENRPLPKFLSKNFELKMN